jgi:hypothetical protein
VNVLNVHDGTGTATETDVFNMFDSHVTSSMWGGISQGASVVEVDVIRLDGTSPTGVLSTGSPSKWTGGSGSTSDPFVPNAPILVSFKTSQRGPAHRGRIYLPFVAENAITDGSLDSGVRSSMQTAWDTFLTAMGTGGSVAQLGVASYKHSSWLSTGTLNVETILGTQKRRQQRLR